MQPARGLFATSVFLTVVLAGANAQQPAPEPGAQTPKASRTWRAGGLDPFAPDTVEQGHDVCAALAALPGLDLYVAVSRGEAKADDVLVHLACGDRGLAASRAALIALAVSGDPDEVGFLRRLAAGADPVRAGNAVEALLLAGRPVDPVVVVRAYRHGDPAARGRLLVAMSVAESADALEAAAALETDQVLAVDARRRLDALR